MHHCDACGWDGETPALREWAGEGCGGVLWTLRVCPTCGEEVYETPVVRVPICSCGDRLGHPGPCQEVF
jgi:hypothetical protein